MNTAHSHRRERERNEEGGARAERGTKEGRAGDGEAAREPEKEAREVEAKRESEIEWIDRGAAPAPCHRC
eukprot:5430317-Pleurochrysis_carterae.AAC.3